MASIVYKLFDKRSKRSGVNIEINPGEQLAKKINKPVIGKFLKRTVYYGFISNIWGADLADMKLISKFNRRFRFLLCSIAIFSKYAWVVPLKDKKGVSITCAFQNILKESNRKPNKISVDKKVNFTITSLKIG